jgi:nitrate reductase gamma subunit
MESTVIGNIAGILILLGFGYFIYTRVKKSKDKKSSSGTGGDSKNPKNDPR